MLTGLVVPRPSRHEQEGQPAKDTAGDERPREVGPDNEGGRQHGAECLAGALHGRVQAQPSAALADGRKVRDRRRDNRAEERRRAAVHRADDHERGETTDGEIGERQRGKDHRPREQDRAPAEDVREGTRRELEDDARQASMPP